MTGLSLLGARGLTDKYITLHVKAIDTKKLSQALGGTAGSAAPLALSLADMVPDFALDSALPLVMRKAKADYGVDLEYMLADAPPPKGHIVKSEFGKGAIVGVATCATGLALWRLIKLL